MKKYALITGASRGLGRAIALELASQGIPVIINFQSRREAAQEVVDEIVANGGEAEMLQCNVSDPDAIESVLQEWEATHPDDYIDILVNNAGIRQDALMIFMQNDQWHQVLDVTLNGFFYITRRLLKNMMTKRHGRVINISSLSGIKGLPGQVNYSAAKAALIGATKALAQEVAPRKITVNAIAPGFMETDMTANLPVNDLKKMVPMGRFGKPQEVADLVAFLASDKSAYITGEVISINGGLYT
ncbi:MAG: 3-oxoacyl-ACP reductase FabG [Ruminococcus flavefaciens]|nr:3-oxoacyl-ACP reductase FabG [Ruminococcus flavefaciens]